MRFVARIISGLVYRITWRKCVFNPVFYSEHYLHLPEASTAEKKPVGLHQPANSIITKYKKSFWDGSKTNQIVLRQRAHAGRDCSTMRRICQNIYQAMLAIQD
jgi:hypothetical protein